MPAGAKQLLMAGVTSVRDLGAPLEDIIAVRNDINNGKSYFSIFGCLILQINPIFFG